MFKLSSGNTQKPADVSRFIDLLNTLAAHPNPGARNLFDKSEIVVARAPGRLDVMGGIADYSGSLVLQMPIAEATFCALQKQPERKLSIISLGDDAQRSASFETPLGDFEEGNAPIAYEKVRAHFSRDKKQHWAAYVAGVFLVLMRERRACFDHGARILIDSRVPEGKGVSSSAAIEVATLQAVCGAFGLNVAPRDAAILCQKVENLIVGAPCGVMDQMASCCGEAHKLLALVCQPAELQPPVAIPEDIAVWGLDSGVRHSVSGADYGSVRVGAFMGYRIIADLAALRVTHSPLSIADPKWNGCLANVTPTEFESVYRDRVPERINGGEFLERYTNTTDSVTCVNPEREYAVRVPTAHPIYEHDRVRRFRVLLQNTSQSSDERLGQLGELMFASHASYSACGLGSSGTDKLVDLVRAAGPKSGLHGAKITGGGSGGTVAVIGRRGADAAVEKVCEEYKRATGHQPYVFRGSSPGAAPFGVVRLNWS